MKKILFGAVLAVGLALMANGVAFAHAASPTAGAVDNHTALEEAEGKAMWEKLRAKEAVCADLSDGDFGALGEYFMGQMMGTSHEAMNAMMAQMLGEDGEEQMHVVMGKRMSGCDASAVYPAGGIGFMPMMQTMMGGGMMGGWSSPSAFSNYNNSMMGFGFAPLGGFGWIFMVLWWALIIAGIVALVRWFANQPRVSRDGEKSPLEILKERYAKGEIDRNEFEEKKKDLLEK